MNTRLPRFYLIAAGSEQIERLVPLGVRLVQLRIKDRPIDDVRAQLLRAKAVCASAGAQLVVNDYWQLAIETGCDYVHLGQSDLDTTDVAALRRANISLGISTHTDAELDRALSLQPDYVALGPIYPTILKEMPVAAQGLARITAWKQKVRPVPLVAIGGFTVDRASGAFAAGADTVAVATDVLLHPDPPARTREWLAVAGG
jgi:thiamine-phosphate pyrophosphorylase